MSFRSEKIQQFRGTESAFRGTYIEDKPLEDVRDLFLEILHNGVHGFCFSLYEQGQKPGDLVSEEQIRRRMEILKPHTAWIRSFSCTEGNELIPKVAKELGLKTMVGAWLGDDPVKNATEIEALIQLAREGFVDIAAVGNEVLYRKDLDEASLLRHLEHVKRQVPGIPVGYVDAYYEFVEKPALTAACDVILCNCYPYWEGTSFDDALPHLRQMHQQVMQVALGKKVVVTETGWPSQGEPLGAAIPAHHNALKYFVNTQLWANDENVEVFYFASFDEDWKVGPEGEVGAHWGIWDSAGALKF